MFRQTAVCLPAGELYTLNPITSADTVTWWCRLCAHQNTATTLPLARSSALEHLTTEHHATLGDTQL